MSAPDTMNQAQKGELMSQIKTQVMVAQAQEMLATITRKCYTKCITKPGTSLDSSDQKCVSMCLDRYMDAQNLVARTFTGRVQRESGGI